MISQIKIYLLIVIITPLIGRTQTDIFGDVFDVASIGYSAHSLAKKPSWHNAGNLAWDIGATALPFVPGSYTAKAIKAANGNSKLSTKLQHGYEIFNVSSKNVAKTGVSGGKLNRNGTSGRAISQVNKWNKTAGFKKYNSRVVVKNIPGRQSILSWEKLNANRLRNLGHKLDRHSRP